MQKIINKKRVKIAAYIVGGCLAALIILFVTATIYLQNNKDKFIAQVKQAFAQNVRGNLQTGKIDISVWTHFPNVGVDIEDVAITDSLRRLPILSAKKISCSVSLFQLATTKPDIEKLKISGGVLHLFIDSAGFDNSYLLALKKKNTSARPSTASQSQLVIIREIEVEDFIFLSEQVLNHKKFQVTIRSAVANIKRKDSLLDISATEDCTINGLGFNVDRGYYLQNATVKANWRLLFDKKNKTLKVNETPVEISGNKFRITADFNFGSVSKFTLHAVSDEILFADAAPILTKKIQEKLSFTKITKPVKVDALLTGSLHGGGDPAVYVTCVAEHNVMQTKFASFDDCSFTGIYANQSNSQQKPCDENSVVYFDRFSGKWAGLELIGDSIRIDNLSTPSFFFNFHSQCSFPQLDDALSLHTVRFNEGSAKLQLQYKGPLIVDYSMFSNITGNLHIENGKITYTPHNLTFENCNGDVMFSKDNIVIKKLTCNYKKNQFTITGNGNGINGSISGGGKSAVQCNVECPVLYATDFKTVFSKNAAIKTVTKNKSLNATIGSMDDVLQKGDMQLNMHAGQFLLGDFIAQNAEVNVFLQQNDWHITNASFDFDGGNFLLSADLRKTGSDFFTDARLGIKSADVQKTFYAFGNFGQSGITSTNIRGTLTAASALTLQLDSTGGIVPGSIQGTASFSIINGALVNFKPLMNIQEYALKNRDLSNVSFAELKDSLTVQQNSVTIPRMEIASTAMHVFVNGVYGINNNATDISIQVPLSNLSKPDAGSPQNKGLDVGGGPSIYLRAKSRDDGKVKLGLDIFKKFRKNKS